MAKPNSGTAKAKATAAPDTLTPASAPVDTAAPADVSTGSDAVSVPSAEPLTGLTIGTELLCEPFENGAAVLGIVTAIEGDDVQIHIADLGTTWPVDLDCIELDAPGTWTHAPEDYPAPGVEPEWDAAHRPWLAPKPVKVDLVVEALTSHGEVAPEPASTVDAQALADIVAPLVGTDGAAVDVPLAVTPPELAEPEPIAVLPTALEFAAEALAAASSSGVGAEPPLIAAAPAPTPPVANHPGAGWALCRVTGPGTVGGTWIQQSTGKQMSVARVDDVGWFTEATLTKFASIGQGYLLTRL